MTHEYNFNMHTEHLGGLVQEWRNSSALAMELRHSCSTNPSIYGHEQGHLSMTLEGSIIEKIDTKTERKNYKQNKRSGTLRMPPPHLVWGLNKTV